MAATLQAEGMMSSVVRNTVCSSLGYRSGVLRLCLNLSTWKPHVAKNSWPINEAGKMPGRTRVLPPVRVRLDLATCLR